MIQTLFSQVPGRGARSVPEKIIKILPSGSIFTCRMQAGFSHYAFFGAVTFPFRHHSSRRTQSRDSSNPTNAPAAVFTVTLGDDTSSDRTAFALTVATFAL